MRYFWMTIAGAAILAACGSATITRAADEPLAIARQGNFYVGGKYVEKNGDMPMVGQAYVQFQIPARQGS